VTLAVLAGIIDTVRRSRNAAQYMNGYKDHLAARRRTRGQLVKMRRAGYFTLDDRPIPNSLEVVDHLVVGPTGVYAIDSEKWDAKLPIRTLNGRRLYLGPESQKERLDHAVWEASQASEILSAALGYDVPVRPALAVYGPKVPWDVTTIRNVDVFTGSALGKYLTQRYRKRNQPSEGVPSLTREEVRTIYDTATRMLPDVAPSRTTTPVG
jgi:type II secretory pathway pseudopilin PulG